MAYESSLAYVLGIKGMALLRALADSGDRDAVESRIAEDTGDTSGTSEAVDDDEREEPGEAESS